MNAPQTFPLNVHRLGPLAQFLPGPPWGAVSKASRSSRLNTRCKMDAAGVLLPIETQPGSQIAMLPALLVNGVEAMELANMSQTARVRTTGKLWRLPEGLRESGTCSKACASLDPKFSILSSTSSRYSPVQESKDPAHSFTKSDGGQDHAQRSPDSGGDRLLRPTPGKFIAKFDGASML